MGKTILGFDPGRDKCGVAVLVDEGIAYHQVIHSREAIATLRHLREIYHLDVIVMGNLTTANSWKVQLKSVFTDLTIVMVNEQFSSVEARDRYWQMYPPKGLSRLIPQGLRTPPRPVDDLVAIILIERYLRGFYEYPVLKP